MSENHVDMRGQTVNLEDRLAQIQNRWLTEAMSEYSSDYAFMLNTIYRLQDEVEEYKTEQESLLKSHRYLASQTQELREDLEMEKKHHGVTLDLFEKAIEELATWRDEAKKARIPS